MVLLVACDVHDHLAAEYHEGHSFAGKPIEEEEKLIVDMSKSLVWPKDILCTLKQKDNPNISTMKTIYNVKKMFKVVQYAGR